MEDEEVLNLHKNLLNIVQKELQELVKEGLTVENLDNAGKLVDIQKDLLNEDYWKKKEEFMSMRYNYSDGGYGGSYGRRGVPGTGRGRYRGSGDMLERMHEHYGAYSEGANSYGRGGSYSGEETMYSLECMLQAMCEFIEKLEQEANSEEEHRLIKKYAKEISEI